MCAFLFFVVMYRGTPYLPLGTDESIYVFVDLINQGEEAHMTQVKITFPIEVAYVRVENIGVSGMNFDLILTKINLG